MADVQQILAEAVRKEREACALYERVAAESQDAIARSLLESLAAEERRHETMLSEVSADALIARKIGNVEDLRITDFLEGQELTPQASFQEVLIYAAKREEEARKTYQALADQATDEALRRLFERLAVEEGGHKSRLERLYDDTVYREN